MIFFAANVRGKKNAIFRRLSGIHRQCLSEMHQIDYDGAVSAWREEFKTMMVKKKPNNA
ncbi:MAG: hypothetical protein R8K53_02120 [Mariprofundaceae bacterium]